MSSIVDSETQKRLLNEACKAATDSKLNLSIAEAHFSYGASGANSFVENQDALQKALQAACQITNHELIQKITKVSGGWINIEQVLMEQSKMFKN